MKIFGLVISKQKTINDLFEKINTLEEKINEISNKPFSDGTKVILKSGNRNKIKNVTCNCGCIFQFVEIKDEIYGDQSHPLKQYNRYVRCPECDSLIKTRDYEQEISQLKQEKK